MKPLWQPNNNLLTHSHMAKFIQTINKKFNQNFTDYPALYAWSIEHPDEFWGLLWKYAKVVHSQPYTEVITPGESFKDTQWFSGAKLNFAENLLRFRDAREAIIFRDEHNNRQSLSYKALYDEVSRLAQGLKTLGITSQDCVVGLMPNRPETITAMLAATSQGAIWSGCSPDFGLHGILDRFGQINPKVLFTVDGYYYNGRAISILDNVKACIEAIPSIEKVVIIPYLHPYTDKDYVTYDNFIKDFKSQDIDFVQVPFNHPNYILYSSGTTGKPKCIVHGAGGTLLQHLKELILHTDLSRDDTICYFTTCGWMMWHWMVSSLAIGATVILYEGSAFYPKRRQLFNLIDEEKISVFGTSAKFITACEKARLNPKQTHDLSTLTTILSTGSPLLPSNYEYVYGKIKSDVRLCSISGGTDIISCFALGNPILPIYKGELQCRGLGMRVEVFNESGESMQQKQGELVCTAPFPNAPVAFWNDPNGRKYHEAYFNRFHNVWAHGDYAEITQHGGLIIYGRSDAVLNPGGIRIGTAEIYRQVETFDEILEAMAVGQDWEGDVRIILFIILREGEDLTKSLQDTIKQTIRKELTPRHVPAKIIAVPDIPRTINGKIMELVIREIIHSRPIKNQDAIANPECLDYFKGLDVLSR